MFLFSFVSSFFFLRRSLYLGVITFHLRLLSSFDIEFFVLVTTVSFWNKKANIEFIFEYAHGNISLNWLNSFTYVFISIKIEQLLNFQSRIKMIFDFCHSNFQKEKKKEIRNTLIKSKLPIIDWLKVYLTKSLLYVYLINY